MRINELQILFVVKVILFVVLFIVHARWPPTASSLLP